MSTLPNGTVTFLFTDVAGSTRHWEQDPDAMRVAMVEHDRIIEALTGQYRGMVVWHRGEGDSRFCVFARATDGVEAAAAIQRKLHEQSWSTRTQVRVRVGLHTGDAELREGYYYGSAVIRCARLRDASPGGQTLLSRTTAELVRSALPSQLSLRDPGEHSLQDQATPEHVFKLVGPGLPDDGGITDEIGAMAKVAVGRGNKIQVGDVGSMFVGGPVEGRDMARVTGARESLTADQAIERIGAAARLASAQLEKNIDQARRESSQFFRLTLIFASLGFIVILAGIALAILGQTAAGAVSAAASLIPEATAALFFNKDKELRRTIESYHQQMLESQQVLTMVEVANTIEVQAERDLMKRRIIVRTLDIVPSTETDSV
ncbi:MAG TPA: adenylate/guanylate cyclase domain-containing protein [Candidatus Binatia bacterium]|nr:adenylate/guanylate cyclase domain-containing protein [Candidatus Binatia bacterium]